FVARVIAFVLRIAPRLIPMLLRARPLPDRTGASLAARLLVTRILRGTDPDEIVTDGLARDAVASITNPAVRATGHDRLTVDVYVAILIRTTFGGQAFA